MDPGATAAPSGSQPADPSTGTPGVANPLTPPTLNTGGPPAAGGPPVANHVIGFGLNPSDDQKLRQEAAMLGAQYYPAGNQAQLLNALGTAAGVINQPGAPAGGGDGWTTALIIAGGLLLVTCIGGAVAVLLVVTKSGSARRAPQPVGAPPGPAASSFSLVSDQGAAHPLATGATRIGRNPDCEVCLAHDERVSACHARITLGPGGTLQITDESRNGTLVDGELLLNATRPLRGSETIQIGQSIFRLRQFGPAAPY